MNLIITQGFDFRPEFKLLVFFFYNAFTVALSFLLFTIGTRNANDNVQKLTEYFICESYGVDVNDPCTLEVNRQSTQALTTVPYLALTLGPYATLWFIFPVDVAKKKWKAWRECVNANR